MADPREPPGRLVHEQRLAFNAELDRPFVLEPWEQRSPRQRELDMRIGTAVAAAERERLLSVLAAGKVRLVLGGGGFRADGSADMVPWAAVEAALAAAGSTAREPS